MPVAASGIAHRTSVQASTRRRCPLVASVPTSQKNATALRYVSVSTSTLPPAQYDTGTVITAHETSSRAMPISALTGGAEFRRTMRSIRWAPMARPAARNAMRSEPSTGNHACGDSRRIAVNAISALNATTLARATAAVSACGTARGRHQASG